MKIVVGISTHGARTRTLAPTLYSLLNQELEPHWSLEVNIYGNDTTLEGLPASPMLHPHWGKNLGVNARLRFQTEDTDLYLLCDDDTIYPPDYVKTCAKLVQPRTLSAFHGSILAPNFQNYRDSRRILSCFRQLNSDTKVHICAGITCFWNPNSFQMPLFDVAPHPALTPRLRGVDVLMSGWCFLNNIPRIVHKHPAAWITTNTQADQTNSVFGDVRKGNTQHTDETILAIGLHKEQL